MSVFNLCPPALIYLVFSIIQIVIDIGKGFYNTAFAKIIVSIIFSILLNYLCLLGLGIVSWIIIFIPFILMSVIISVLLYVLGLKPTSGRLQIYKNNQRQQHPKPHHQDSQHPKPHHQDSQHPKQHHQESELMTLYHKEKKSKKSKSHHHHPHTHNRKYEHDRILHKIKKDRKVKKNKKEVNPHHFKHNKKRHERIEHDNEDLDNNNKYDKMSEKEINNSIDSMLNQLKHKYD